MEDDEDFFEIFPSQKDDELEDFPFPSEEDVIDLGEEIDEFL